MIDKVDAVEVPGAQLSDLANGAGDRVLMALGAGLRVVDWPKPIGDLVALLESGAVGVELSLSGETIGQVVKASRGLCLTINGVAHEKRGTDPYREEDQHGYLQHPHRIFPPELCE